jgi:hypothetical protein
VYGRPPVLIALPTLAGPSPSLAPRDELVAPAPAPTTT